MESLGAIAIILICGLFADNMLMKGKLKDLGEKIRNLENALHNS